MLALDTSGGELLVALVDIDAGGAPAGLAEAGGRHQDRVIAAIGEVVGQEGLGGVDAIAVASGPGSHTGLRVGLATAEGLAFARRLTIYPLSSLAVAAHRARIESGVVVAVVDAGRGRIHAQRFEAGPGWRHPVGNPLLTTLEDLDAGGLVSGEPALMAGAADGGRAVAPLWPGSDALAAAVIEAVGAGRAVAYHELKGDYGELSMETRP